MALYWSFDVKNNGGANPVTFNIQLPTWPLSHMCSRYHGGLYCCAFMGTEKVHGSSIHFCAATLEAHRGNEAMAERLGKHAGGICGVRGGIVHRGIVARAGGRRRSGVIHL